MSIDLKTQLHDYFEYVDEGQGTVDLEAVALTAEPVKLTPRRRTRTVPGWAYGVAFAIVALLLVGGLAWLIRPITPASPVISQPPSPSVTAAPDSSGNGWMRVDDEVAFPRRVGAISSVVVGGPGLVAVGWYAPPFDDQAGTTPTPPPPTLVQPDSPQEDGPLSMVSPGRGSSTTTQFSAVSGISAYTMWLWVPPGCWWRSAIWCGCHLTG